MPTRARVLVLGAAGRDFHDFNTVFRDDPRCEVVGFTAAQVPGIERRRYPPELAGPLYPDGIPIHPEAELERIVRERAVDRVVLCYSDLSHAAVMHLASRRDASLGPFAIAMVQAVGGLVGVALENAALRELMVAQQDRLRALAEGAVRAREEEARRIAHELHDEAGQLLASVHIALDELIAQVPERSHAVQRIHGLLDRVEGQLRRLSRELRPTILDDLGLGPAVEWLAQGAAERTGVSITVHAPIKRLPSAMETALYRIIQEAVTNAIRHAGARTMEIRVWQEDTTVHAAVRDDGHGFDAEATMARRGDRGLGLLGMRERVDALGGRFALRSAPGQGTEVAVAIPIVEDP